MQKTRFDSKVAQLRQVAIDGFGASRELHLNVTETIEFDTLTARNTKVGTKYDTKQKTNGSFTKTNKS